MTTTPLRISLMQVPIAWESPADNIRHVETFLPAPGETDLIILPEMWATGFTMHPARAAEPARGTAWQWMGHTAARMGAAVTGSLAVQADGRFYNRWYIRYPEGGSEQYDKRHLFSYGGEDRSFTPGADRLVVNLNGWRIMPVICYDLRFPAWCRNTSGYDVLLVVANWPAARIHHWDALLRARAIENQCYVVAVNRIGSDPTPLAYPGHSAVYDMNGDTLVFAGDREGRFDVELDSEKLSSFRTRFPFLADRDRLNEIPV